jgi:UDP-N-acetylmuramyl pentapeptide phosphotransferase/UDP-N-acetylglucosamine-1-phosphate transferase
MKRKKQDNLHDMKNTKNVRWCILVLAICSTIFVTACGRSSFDAANELLRKYPNAELREIPRMGGVVEFMVRTESGAVLSVTFADNGEMLAPSEIFPAKTIGLTKHYPLP